MFRDQVPGLDGYTVAFHTQCWEVMFRGQFPGRDGYTVAFHAQCWEVMMWVLQSRTSMADVLLRKVLVPLMWLWSQRRWNQGADKFQTYYLGRCVQNHLQSVDGKTWEGYAQIVGRPTTCFHQWKTDYRFLFLWQMSVWIQDQGVVSQVSYSSWIYGRPMITVIGIFYWKSWLRGALVPDGSGE